MDDADTPPTQSADFLVPPTKIPRTALAVATPPPPREPRNVRQTPVSFAGLVTEVLDKVDAVADAVATGLGLRNR